MLLDTRRAFNARLLGTLTAYGLLETLYRHDLFADATPKTLLRGVPFDRLRSELPGDTPVVAPAERSAVLVRRSQALQRRYAY